MQRAPCVESSLNARQQAHEAEAEHEEAEADHDAERPEHYRNRRPVLPWDCVEAVQRDIKVVLKDQRRQLRYLDSVADRGCVLIGQAEQQQRRAVGMALKMPFHGHDLRGLVLEGIEAVRVACEDLQGRDDEQQAHCHREHHPSALTAWSAAALAQQMPGANRADDEGSSEVGGQNHMDEPIRQRRVEDDRPPIYGHELPLSADGISRRRLHPGVYGEDPEGGEQRPGSDQ